MTTIHFTLLATSVTASAVILALAACTPPDQFQPFDEDANSQSEGAPGSVVDGSADRADADASKPGDKPEELFLAYCRRVHGFGGLLVGKCCATAAERAFEAPASTSEDNAVAACSRLLVESMGRGRMTRDLASETACMAALDPSLVPCSARKAEAQRVSERLFLADLPAACRDVYRGSVAAGSACRWTDECASGLVCRGGDVDKKVDGVCHVPGAAGDPCEADEVGLGLGAFSYRRTASACAVGLRCEVGPGSSSGSCVAGTTPIDGVCGSDGSCVAGTTCTEGICRAPRSKGMGAACGGALQCASDLYCPLPEIVPSSPRPTCRLRGDAGSPCSNDDDCSGRCASATKRCVAHCGSS